ncbi:MAG: guanosine-3',5'-bis(diphosphate) 3'-pyrophosphohydrolase [Bacteroidetes bacterium]|nr:MAG: guanosine-3',5'-bis(diphosphate) 3'-pyrophosphohydrolase [Bacteroidota bacterium]
MKLLISAIHFASRAHAGQLRKDKLTPYINHPLEVMQLLSKHGDVRNETFLCAAVLHDIVEDTSITIRDIEKLFNTRIASIVWEVTDDKDTPKQERKRLQAERAHLLSEGAKLIRLADKISNVKDILHAPPASWDIAERRKYVLWTREVVQPIRGINPPLELMYDELLVRADDILK